MQLSYTLESIIDIVGSCEVEGSTTDIIKGIASLKEAGAGDISFLGNKKYKTEASESKASVILLNDSFPGTPKENQVYLRVEDPSYALLKLCHDIEVNHWPFQPEGVHPTAFVDSEAEVDPTASIGPQCVVLAGAKIGPGVMLQSQVFVGYHAVIQEHTYVASKAVIQDFCEVGKECYIDSNVVLGSKGFGYTTISGEHVREPQVGKVIIEDKVDIGAGTMIDRARFSVTRIGEGTKIDNLVQIAHNVTIGKHCLIVAQVGIAGSCTIEDYVVLGGQVGVAGHLTIGAGCMIGAQSGLNHDLEPKSYVRGTPVYPYVQAQKLEIYKKRLPDLYKRVGELEEVVAAFKSEECRIE